MGDLRNVPGDLEGNVEHNLCALHTAAFCRVFDAGDVCDKARVRVFFPDAEEVATHSVGRVENSFSVTVGVEATFNDFEGKLDVRACVRSCSPAPSRARVRTSQTRLQPCMRGADWAGRAAHLGTT